MIYSSQEQIPDSAGVALAPNMRLPQVNIFKAIAPAIAGIEKKIENNKAQKEKIKQQLQLKYQKAIDIEATSKASNIRKMAEINMSSIQETLPPQEWQTQANKIHQKAAREISKLNATGGTKKKIETDTLLWAKLSDAKLQASATKRQSAIAFDAATIQYQDAIIYGGNVDEARQNLIEALALKNGTNKDAQVVSAEYMQKIEADALKERAGNTYKNLTDMAVQAPQQSIAVLEAEIEARAKGKGNGQFVDLDSKQLDNIVNVAKNVISTQEAEEKQRQKELTAEDYDTINTAIKNSDPNTHNIISNSMNLTEAQKLKQHNLATQIAKMNNPPEISDQSSFIELENARRDVREGRMTPSEYQQKATEFYSKGLVDEKTFRSEVTKATTAYQQMTNDVVKKTQAIAKSILVEPAIANEDQLMLDIEAARKKGDIELASDLSAVLTASSRKRQAQWWNYQNVSSEIEALLEDPKFKDATPDDLRKAANYVIKAHNISHLELYKTMVNTGVWKDVKPTKEFKDWDKYSPELKFDIWQKLEQGTPVKDVLEAVNRYLGEAK